MLLAEVAKGKSSMTCVKISSGTVQLEVCHSAFAFHGFCHTRAELQTIRRRVTFPKGLSDASVGLFPLLLLLC